MSAYPLRVSAREFQWQHISELLDYASRAVEFGIRGRDIRERLHHILASIQVLDPDAVPSLYQWIEGEYNQRLRCATSRQALIEAKHELQKLWGLVDGLEREARDLDEHWGEE